MNNPICNTVFDTRDLIEYRKYLEKELISSFNSFMEDENEDWEEIDNFEEINITHEGFVEEYGDDIIEYRKISDFCEELSYSPDFEYGETVIHEDYWEEYVEELIKDCGYISKDFPTWIIIDWKATANNLAQDYMRIEFENKNYFIRR